MVEPAAAPSQEPAEPTASVRDSDASREDAHTAELQAVKLRAVKKIKALEERVKAASSEGDAQQVARQVLCAEVGALEQDAFHAASLRTALSQQQQHELSLSGALQALQLSKVAAEDAHASEVSALSQEVSVLQEEREAFVSAQAAMRVENDTLRTQRESARKAEADARAAAQQEAEQSGRQDAVQKEKIAKLKALLADARVLIKSAPPPTESNGTAAPPVGEASRHPGAAMSPEMLKTIAAQGAAGIRALAGEVRHLEAALERSLRRPPSTPAPPQSQPAAQLASPEPTAALMSPGDSGGGAASDSKATASLRRELSEVRQKARRLMEDKDKELARTKAHAAEAHARASQLEQRLKEAEVRAELEAAERAAEAMNAAAERAAAEQEAAAQTVSARAAPNGAAAMAGASVGMAPSEATAGALAPADILEQSRAAEAEVGEGGAVRGPAVGTELSLLSGSLGPTGALLQLAQQQASRDAQVNGVHRELSQLRDELASAGATEAALREQLREVEMTDRRSAASSEYVKCLVLKLLQTDESEHAALFPALATCLQFSQAEVEGLMQAREARRSSGGLFSSIVRRQRPSVGASIDRESAEMALELASRAPLRARQSDLTAIATLSAQLGELDEQIARLTVHEERRRDDQLESAYASASAKESETRAKDEAHQADASERLYLRNVLLRYMETEDHTAMFPVVAMCLRLTAQEVEAIHERRAKRERERRPAWRIGLFG